VDAITVAGTPQAISEFTHQQRPRLHGVTPEEVEEVCFGKSLVRRAKSDGENPVYYVLGQTEAGRYLFCVVIRFPDDNGYPVTAREMTAKEKRRYRKWKDR
jgi:uncharacterized DUF497 family protein